MDNDYFAKYLPVSERDINWQIYCPSAGHENISRVVAFRLSFENPYYFSRIFKKKTGLSPSAWH